MPAQSPTLSPTLSAITAGIPRVVLGDPGLDLADEVGTDIGRLREDPASEPGEDRDEGAAESEADQVLRRLVRALIEPGGEDPVVARDSEESEPDDEKAGHRARAERNLERRPDAALRSLGGADIGADSHVHPGEAGCGGKDRADQEAEGGAPAEIVPETDAEEDDDRDDADRHVLPAKVGGGTLLDGQRDLLHAVGAFGQSEEPNRQP